MKSLLIFLLVACWSARAQDPARHRLEAALNDSVQAATRTIEKGPESDGLYIRRGYFLCLLGAYDRAVRDFDRALAINDRNHEAFYYRAVCRKHQGDYGGAAGDLKAALSIFPDDGSYYTELGNLYLGQGRYQEALEYLHKAQEKNPDDGVTHLLRGTCYYLLKKYDRAIADLSKAIGLGHDLEKACFLRANCYKEQERTDLAVQDYSRVIKLNPEHFRAYFHRGLIRLDRGDKKGGIADLNAYLKFQGKINPSAEEVRVLIRKHGAEPQY